MTCHVSFAEFCKDLAKYLDEVRTAPVNVERDAGSVVIMSEEEFESWKETIYLLKSPANAAELMRAIKAADAGEFEEHKLVGEQ